MLYIKSDWYNRLKPKTVTTIKIHGLVFEKFAKQNQLLYSCGGELAHDVIGHQLLLKNDE